jgi:hypothetical protein
MAKPVTQAPKKPYSKPSLTIYGNVQELTKTRGTNGNKDGATGMKSVRTHV